MVSDTDEDEHLSGSDTDKAFDEDMEALSRACILSGTDPQTLRSSSSAAVSASESEEDDLELFRGIQQRFSACSQTEVPLSLKPLSTLPPATSDDDEDDFETLRVIQRRFSSYEKDAGDLKRNTEIYMNKQAQVRANNSSNHELDKAKVSKAVLDSIDVQKTSENLETLDKPHSDLLPSGITGGHESDTHDLAIVPSQGSGFPRLGQMFVDAIQKNRACQKFIRKRMMQIQARIEENRKLQQHVKVLKSFQIACKKQTRQALSQKLDTRVQLISVAKPKGKLKADGKKAALSLGPAENSHVASYKMVLTKFPLSLSRRKWTDEERKNLVKGIKQQFQERLLQRSVDLISEVEGDSNEVDGILASIRNLEITPYMIKMFLPKVDWARLASMYVKYRSGAECEARWLNWEDSLINHKSWTHLEDKKLLHIVQQRGISNWIEIAVLLETNRTPFQCLARYQRSLNASVIRSEWSEEEDEKLRAAVASFGESNWETVASTLVGRTGPQCSNRWLKTLHPARERTGRWSMDEDKRLKVAVTFYGPQNWKKIAQFVPGRTQVQCRERWVNCLDPSLVLGEWTEEEDSKLRTAIVNHGYCWSKVAACVSPRTDNQCMRRWKVLFPDEVLLLQAARRIQKAALISNFVDRESERPTLGPNDFVPLGLTNGISEFGELNQSGKRRRKPRSQKASVETQICPDQIELLENVTDVESIAGDNANAKKKRATGQRMKIRDAFEPTEDVRDPRDDMPIDGETKKKRNTTRRRLNDKEAFGPNEDVRDGPEGMPFDGETKKKRTTRRQHLKDKKAFESIEDVRDGIDALPIGGKIKEKKIVRRHLKNNKTYEPTEDVRDGLEDMPIDEKRKKATVRQCLKNNEAGEPTEDVIDGLEGMPFDGETKKKKTTRRQQLKNKKASDSTEDVRDGLAIVPFDGEAMKEKTMRPQLLKNKEASGQTEDVSLVGLPIDGETKKKKIRRQRMTLKRQGLKEKDGVKDCAVLQGEITMGSCCERASTCPTNSNASACGESELLTVTNIEEVGEHTTVMTGPEYGRSSEVGWKRNRPGKRFNYAALCSGENEAFSGVKMFSLHLKHDERPGPAEVNSSPCPDSTSLGVTNACEANTFGNITSKKREMRSFMNCSGLDDSCIKPMFMMDEEVGAIGENERHVILGMGGGDIESSVPDQSSAQGERKGIKSHMRKSENSVLVGENGAHRGKRLKWSRTGEGMCNGHEFGGEDGDDMTLASFIKRIQKKRRLNNLAMESPTFSELSIEPRGIHRLPDLGDCDPDDTCSPASGFENPICE